MDKSRMEGDRDDLIAEGRREPGVAEAMRIYEALYPMRETQAAIVAAQFPTGSNATSASGLRP